MNNFLFDSKYSFLLFDEFNSKCHIVKLDKKQNSNACHGSVRISCQMDQTNQIKLPFTCVY